MTTIKPPEEKYSKENNNNKIEYKNFPTATFTHP